MAKMHIDLFYPWRALKWIIIVSIPVYALFGYSMPEGLLLVTLLAGLMFSLMFFKERSPFTTCVVVFLFWLPIIFMQIINPDIIGIEYREEYYGIIMVICAALCHSSLQGFLRHWANHISWMNREEKY